MEMVLLIFLFLNGLLADRSEILTTNEDIRNTWQKENLEMCTQPNKYQPSISLKLTCERIFNQQIFQFLNVEILSQKPALIRVHGFGTNQMIQQIYDTFINSTKIKNQQVEGRGYSAGHRGRVADGIWLEHHEPSVQPLFKRIQTVFRVNPAIAENFLILKYNIFGHYAPHYDALDPMHRSYDNGWFEFFGNRMATALFIVRTADQGGGTVFPLLNLTIQPEKDLLLWLNTDSNNNKEINSLHAACPIEKGEKMAVSLWVRANFQDQLKCSMEDQRYDAKMLVGHSNELRFNSRPQIQLEYDEDDLWPVEEEDEDDERSYYDD